MMAAFEKKYNHLILEKIMKLETLVNDLSLEQAKL